MIGPKQLPEVAKVVARTLNELKRATRDITGTLAQVKTDTRSKVDEFVNDLAEDDGDVEEDYHNIGEEDHHHDDHDHNHDDHIEEDEDGQLSLLTDDDTDRS